MIKKLLSVLLAWVMMLSTGVVAFARSYTSAIVVNFPQTYYLYNAKEKTMDFNYSDDPAPGTTLYYWIESADLYYGDGSGSPQIKSVDALKKYRLGYHVNEGKHSISSVKFVVLPVHGGDLPIQERGKYAFIAVDTKDTYNSDEVEIDLTIEVAALGEARILDTEPTFEVSMNLQYGTTYASNYTAVMDDEPIVNFEDISDNDPIELYFGDDEVEFVVNAHNQKELYLKYYNDPTGTIYDLSGAFPNAAIDYHLFAGSNKTFRRTGQLAIRAASLGNGKAPYIYQVEAKNGGLSFTIPKGTYDFNQEMFFFDTATLNNYVVSDQKLGK